MQNRPQSFSNHRSLPPPVLIAAGLVLLVEVGRRVWLATRAPDLEHLWLVVVWSTLFVAWYQLRRRAQIVQDRVIRLEMRLRLERLLAPARRGDVERLQLSQIIALRFAGDAELPALFEQVLAGQLVPPQAIKRAVRDWQADWLRV